MYRGDFYSVAAIYTEILVGEVSLHRKQSSEEYNITKNTELGLVESE